MEQFQDLRKCSICTLKFDLRKHVPKNLPCGHVFCVVCVKLLVKGNNVPCPNCKELHSLPSRGVEGFGTNHAITGILGTFCDTCDTPGRTRKCGVCDDQLCGSCLEPHQLSHHNSVIQTAVGGTEASCGRFEASLKKFLDRVNTTVVDSKYFCRKAASVDHTKLSPSDVKEIEAKAKEFTDQFDCLLPYLSDDYPRIDPHVKCLESAELQDQPKSPMSGNQHVYVDVRLYELQFHDV